MCVDVGQENAQLAPKQIPWRINAEKAKTQWGDLKSPAFGKYYIQTQKAAKLNECGLIYSEMPNLTFYFYINYHFNPFVML